MNLSSLITKLSLHYPDIPIDTLDRMTRCLFKTMKKALVNRQRIEFRDFGSFNPKIRPAMQARNPKTGEIIEVESMVTIRFKPAKKLRQRVNIPSLTVKSET